MMRREPQALEFLTAFDALALTAALLSPSSRARFRRLETRSRISRGKRSF